jgi:hypothetical protein
LYPNYARIICRDLRLDKSTTLDAVIYKLNDLLLIRRLRPHTKATLRRTARTIETAHEEGVATAAVAVKVAITQAIADAAAAILRLTTPCYLHLYRLRRPNCLK